MNEAAEKFLRALGAGLGSEERLILCAFPGDPGEAPPHAWRPRPWHPEFGTRHKFPSSWNGYVTVGTFGQSEDGTFRRRAAYCRGGLALMVDDVGTKVPRETVSVLVPSARIETSPGNEQWWYFLSEPERDPVRFDALIRAFIDKQLLGNDPGMAGVTRVGRMPGFQNLKPEYGGWEVKLLELSERRFTVKELLAEFDLELLGRREPPPWQRRVSLAQFDERVAAYDAVEEFLRQSGMLKKDEADPSGWTDITCPWVDGHTNAIDNGAAVREPYEENQYYGSFRCHHGSCIDRGWRHLTEWVAEEAEARMGDINERDDFEI